MLQFAIIKDYKKIIHIQIHIFVMSNERFLKYVSAQQKKKKKSSTNV